jgi:polar amino acid transport system substrate-binding protein
VRIRTTALAAVLATATVTMAGCSSIAKTPTAGSSSCSHTAIQSELYQKGVLTVATDKPAYPPWFASNNPANGKGYESAVAYAVAARLGFQSSQVHWAYEPFNDSYAPGPKKFDFDINEISVTPQRAQAVSFSISYYADQQALVALKGTPIVTHHTPADLKGYVFGDQVGSTSLAVINSSIQPTQTPKVFETLNDSKQALQTHQIAALVADTPTAQYISTQQIPHSVMVGQFPSTGAHFGLLFHKGDPLVACVNKALTALTSNGTLHKLAQKYLQIYLSVPVIKP